ncbi:hypothetical protein RF55_14997 [Lasius niger]|uniref:Uncharacterized protein n=1 Tax=Lasius niger TaxID=67767 RepID=A0A0J7K7A2_LASNI|nr:hypothetical protein RF55_14997 [Lasius niger]
MASEPEKTSESESEIVNLETQDLSNERREEENIEMEIISNPEESKQTKACEEDPYIVKLFKSLMKPESQKNSVEKKK